MVGGQVAEQPVDPLRISHCPECGYALDGLAGVGRCPECGTGYDPGREVVLFGWEGAVEPPCRGRGEGAVRAGRMGAGGVLMAWAGVLVARVWAGRDGWEGLLLAAALVVVGLWLWWRAWTEVELPRPVQVRLSARGFGQRYAAGPVRRRRRWRTGEPWWLVREGEVYRLHVGRRMRSWRRAASGRPLLDFWFECDERASGVLRERIEGFRREALGGREGE